MPQVITSRQNARVRELRAALRGHAPEGFAAIEGWVLVAEAIMAQSRHCGPAVEALFIREDEEHNAALAYGTLPYIVLANDVFDSASATNHPQGIAAIIRKPSVSYTPTSNDLLLVAAGIQDPGNLGTLIRSAEAFGAAAVILAEQAVDPWNGKCLRASAGAVFRLPLPRWTDALSAELKTREIKLLAAVPTEVEAVPAHLANLTTGCAFLIGNEGGGLSKPMLALADARIHLHMPGPTESLNAAVAGSLLLYEAARQRRQT